MNNEHTTHSEGFIIVDMFMQSKYVLLSYSWWSTQPMGSLTAKVETKGTLSATLECAQVYVKNQGGGTVHEGQAFKGSLSLACVYYIYMIQVMCI